MCSGCFTIKMIPLCAIPTLWMVCISAQLFLRYYAITNRYITSLVMNKVSNTKLGWGECKSSGALFEWFWSAFPNSFVCLECLFGFICCHIQCEPRKRCLHFWCTWNSQLHIVECCSFLHLIFSSQKVVGT